MRHPSTTFSLLRRACEMRLQRGFALFARRRSKPSVMPRPRRLWTLMALNSRPRRITFANPTDFLHGDGFTFPQSALGLACILESSNPMTTPTGYRPEAPGVQPLNAFPAYVNTRKRAPAHEPIRLVQTLSEITGPGVGWDIVPEPALGEAADISHHNGADALGERIVVGGRVLDEDGRGIAAPSSRSGKRMRPAATIIQPTNMTLRLIRIFQVSRES